MKGEERALIDGKVQFSSEVSSCRDATEKFLRHLSPEAQFSEMCKTGQSVELRYAFFSIHRSSLFAMKNERDIFGVLSFDVWQAFWVKQRVKRTWSVQLFKLAVGSSDSVDDELRVLPFSQSARDVGHKAKPSGTRIRRNARISHSAERVQAREDPPRRNSTY